MRRVRERCMKIKIASAESVSESERISTFLLHKKTQLIAELRFLIFRFLVNYNPNCILKTSG